MTIHNFASHAGNDTHMFVKVGYRIDDPLGNLLMKDLTRLQLDFSSRLEHDAVRFFVKHHKRPQPVEERVVGDTVAVSIFNLDITMEITLRLYVECDSRDVLADVIDRCVLKMVERITRVAVSNAKIDYGVLYSVD